MLNVPKRSIIDRDTRSIDGNFQPVEKNVGRKAILKRVFDIALCAFAAPIVIPTIFFVWIIVKSDGGSGFYVQDRVGRGGCLFRCWKLRTMLPDADARLRKLLREDASAREEWSQTQKLQNDPRITRLGKFLRKSHLDEFPQFWNVFRGEMSIVGPRPVLKEELERYGTSDVYYLSVRPGVTGAWQVSGAGRNEISYSERVALDVDYVNAANFLTDLKIIFRTVFAVFEKTGR